MNSVTFKNLVIFASIFFGVNAFSQGKYKDYAYEAAREMFNSYKEAGVNGMMSRESSCWKSIPRSSENLKEDGFIKCSLYMTAGAYIEASYARQQMRGPFPYYSPQGLKERIRTEAEKIGISEEDKSNLMVDEVASAMTIGLIEGLFAAGMR